jgi:NAD(P)H-dependent FMN reductase
MKVLVLSGSPRPLSRTLLAAALVGEMLRRTGATPTVWDLAVRPLPFANPDYHSEPAANPVPVVNRFVREAAGADAFLLASPVYHNSFSGILKNALDTLSIAQLSHKPVGLIAFGSSLTAVQVCDQMRIVVRGLLGLAVPTQLVAVPSDFRADGDGPPRIGSPQLVRRARRMADEIQMFACADTTVDRSNA